MKRKRHTPEQAVRKLREGEKRLNAGEDLGLVLRHLEITESTWNRWRSTYGAMKAADAKELKELRVENARSIPSALCGCGAPIVFSGPRSGATNGSASATAPRRSCGTGAGTRAPTTTTSKHP